MRLITIFTILIFLFSFNSIKKTTPIKVEIRHENGVYQLYRDGKPYQIKGAGCEFGSYKSLASFGANSVRTWSTENARQNGQQMLDSAQKYGLTILMGLDLGSERLGFDYNNDSAVQKQFERIKGEVLKYKDHPALLAWGVGNELNLFYKNPKVWDAVNQIAKMIHQIDPNHPTTTMLSGMPKPVVEEIKVRCPDIDFLCVQMYADIINLKKRIDDSGWKGAYMITEWGATGHWEVAITKWGVPVEQTSTEKAASIKKRWDKAVNADKTQCIGSYIFVWEPKQERTPTWYGLILESGESTEMTDVMYEAWNGKLPENTTPKIDSIFLNNKTRYGNIYVESGKDCSIKVYTHDNDNDKLVITSVIITDDPTLYRDGGEREVQSKTLKCKMKINSKTMTVNFKAPDKEGGYRAYIYVHDGKNHAATANIPFFVKKQ
jgi:hypothetical protein